ncbi:MAG: DNA replication/repair protein RecF [Bdellovibrionia bacterium]
MNFKKIELVHFRNFDSLSVELNPGINVFAGPNGQGKTNFVESLYFLSRGTSFRTSYAAHLVKEDFEIEGAHVFAEFSRGGVDNRVEAHVVEAKKNILLNQKKVSPSQLVHHLPCVLFSPESLLAIKEGPNLRRELLDEMIVTLNPANMKTILEFQKALRSRNRILKEAEGRPQDLKVLLPAMDEIYLEKAVELAWTRLECIRRINPEVSAIMKVLSGQKAMDTFIDYLVSDESASEWTREKLVDAARNRMRELRTAEVATGMTLVGPHRHDIKIIYGKRDSRFYCSQGQQRALILSLKMTQIVHHHRIYGSFPTLFLDDVLSELDGEKRAFLIDFLMGIETQSILTTTDFSIFGDVENKLTVFHVNRGTIEV